MMGFWWQDTWVYSAHRIVESLWISLSKVFAFGHWIATFIALHNGLGKSSGLLTKAQQHNASKVYSSPCHWITSPTVLSTPILTIPLNQAIFAGRLPFVIALYSAKCSVIILIRRVFTRDMKKIWWTCNIAIYVVVAWGLLAIITISARCSPDSVLEKDRFAKCPNYVCDLILLTSTTLTITSRRHDGNLFLSSMHSASLESWSLSSASYWASKCTSVTS